MGGGEEGNEPAADDGDANLRLSDASFRLRQVARNLPPTRLAPKAADFANPPDLILIGYETGRDRTKNRPRTPETCRPRR